MLTIERIEPHALSEYARVSIAYRVESELRPTLIEDGLGGIRLSEERLTAPYCKDYDAIGDSGPESWRDYFDLTHWALLLAKEEGRPVGGVALATRTPGLSILEGREDLAAIWDIRVDPDYRRHGVGSALFRRAAEEARTRGCRQMAVETQNNNVAACRFYASQGCRLGAIHRFAYARFGYGSDNLVARETMLVWYLDL